jgi:hypothetical protein
MPTNPPERVVDSRNRISLAGFADHQRYRIEKMTDGSICLTPVMSVPVAVGAGGTTPPPQRPGTSLRRERVQPRFKKGGK